MASLPDADQSGFPLPRFDSCSADRAGSGDVHGPGATRRFPRHSGMAEFLFQVTDDGPGSLSRARPFHSIDEAEEHSALDDGRGTDHAPWAGILRLVRCPQKRGPSPEYGPYNYR